MENGDDTSSVKTDSNNSASSSSSAPGRKPCCARCRNHRVKVALKGHKRVCPYKSCECVKCAITADRQRITAMQIALRRALAEDETKVIAQGEVEPAPFIVKGSRMVSRSRSIGCHESNGYDSFGDSSVSEHNSNGACSGISGVVGVPTLSRLPPLHPQKGAIADLPAVTAGDNVEILLEYSTKLLELFQYSWKMLPLMYVIVKKSGYNLEEAVRRIVEGNNDLRAMDFLKAGYTASMGIADAPTYEGQVPYIGKSPLMNSIYTEPFSYSLGAQVPLTKVPSSPETPSDHSTT